LFNSNGCASAAVRRFLGKLNWHINLLMGPKNIIHMYSFWKLNQTKQFNIYVHYFVYSLLFQLNLIIKSWS
jgi:hypothetical protein